MRITNQMMIQNAIQHMADNMDGINTYSNRISLGKQFLNASDDPVAASLCLNLKSTLKTTDTYKSTAELADDWMSANEFAFEQTEKIANQAINLVQRGLNDTLSVSERASALGTEMDKLYQQAMDIGNFSHNGQYLFSGYLTDQKPFVTQADGSPAYLGDANTITRTIAPGQTVQVNVNGNNALLPFMQALFQARNDLNADPTGDLGADLTALQKALNTIDENRTSNGARQRQVQTATDYLDKVKLEVQGLLSKKEDVNLAEAISMLQGQETTYKSVLEVSQRAISALNLFDYLQ